MNVKVGDWIRIINMVGEEGFNGAEGEVTHIDSLGILRGTWGWCGVIPDADDFVVIS